jgi:hypothetical protein
MASYHCSVKTGGKGRAGKHGDYISREGKYSPELTKGNSSKLEDLEHKASGNMPAWAAHDAGIFWRAADEHERANGATYREIEVALPRELNPAQRQELVEDFIQQQIGERHPYTYAIHIPKAAIEKGEQPHAHIMYSERTLDGIARDPELFFKRANTKQPERGGCKKDSAGTKERLLATRELWANVQNKHLERAGVDERVTHLSLRAQGIDRTPEVHLGPVLAREHAPALREHRAAERELAQTPQVDATAELAAQAQAQADREAAQAQAAQQARETAEAQQQADREARRQAAREAAEINSKLTAEKEEKENDRIRKSALAALAKASGATDSAIAVAVTDHASIGRDVQTAKGSVLAARDANRASNVIAANHGPSFGSAAKRAERREFRKHLESGTPAVAKQLRPINRVVQQLVEFLPAVISTIAAAAKAVTQQAQARQDARETFRQVQAAEQARRQAQAQQQARQEAEARARQEAAAEAKAKAEQQKKAVAGLVTEREQELAARTLAALQKDDHRELERCYMQAGVLRREALQDLADASPQPVNRLAIEHRIKQEQCDSARKAGDREPWAFEGPDQHVCRWDAAAKSAESDLEKHIKSDRPTGFFQRGEAKAWDAQKDELQRLAVGWAQSAERVKRELRTETASRVERAEAVEANRAAKNAPQQALHAGRVGALDELSKALETALKPHRERERQRDIDHGDDFGR